VGLNSLKSHNLTNVYPNNKNNNKNKNKKNKKNNNVKSKPLELRSRVKNCRDTRMTFGISTSFIFDDSSSQLDVLRAKLLSVRYIKKEVL
jgi:hypothetical protein